VENHPSKITHYLNDSFELEMDDSCIQDPDIQSKLSQVIYKLILEDQHQLIQGLYRIDVEEEKALYLLDNQSPEIAAPALSNLILDRIRQKIAWRKHYSR